MLSQDHELIVRFKNGDQSAYVELYQKHIRYAFGTALLLLKEGVNLGPDTPTLVGRFGPYETSAIKVSNKINGSDSEHVILDIRQTTASEVNQSYPPDIEIITEKVKINNNDGLLTDGDGVPPILYWTDGKYCFRMFGLQDKGELIKIAESMK